MIYWTIYKWTANVQDAQPSIWRRMMSRRRAPCGTTKLWSLIYDSSMVWTTALDVSIVCRRPSMGYAALRNGGTTRANESPGPYLSMACFLSASLAWQPGLVVEEQSNLDRFWKAVRKGQKGQNFFYLTAFNYVRFLIKLLSARVSDHSSASGISLLSGGALPRIGARWHQLPARARTTVARF